MKVFQHTMQLTSGGNLRPAICVVVVMRALLLVSAGLDMGPQTGRSSCIRLLNAPLLYVDQASGSGTTMLLLRNQTSRPAELALTAAPFSPPSQISVEFADLSSTSSSPAFELTVPPKTNVRVTMVAKGVWSDGDYDVELMNHYGAEHIGTVHLRRIPVSISLKDGKLTLSLVDGQPARIGVKNEDPIGYPVYWQLMNSQTICEGYAALDPKSSLLLECTPHVGWFWAGLTQAIKPEISHDGYSLILLPQPIRQLAHNVALQPLASFRGEASLNYYNPSPQAAIRYLITFVLLGIGGVTSLALSYYIPNKLVRLDLRERLLSLAARTSDLSSRIDSRLAVIVRLERSRLTGLLQTRGAFSPDFMTLADRCRAGVELLTSKVCILEQMDTVLGLLEERQIVGAPPTRVDQIHNALNDAKVLLSKSEMSDDDLRAAKLAVEFASKQVNALNDRSDEFGRKLAENCSELAADLDKLSNTESYAALSQQVSRLIEDVKAVKVSLVEPENYVDVDYALHRARIILSYIRLRAGITSADVMERLHRRTNDLVNLLERQSWDGLRSARLLLREMQDDIYPERIVEAVQRSANDEASKEAEIQIDPAYVYEQSPVEFRVRFYSPALDTCAAREQFVVTWDYGDRLVGEGWVASHYFLPRRKRLFELLSLLRLTPYRYNVFPITARLLDPEGKPIQFPTGGMAPLRRDVVVHRSELWRGGERTRAESIKLTIALLIAAIGLVSGAQAQIDRLDLIPGLVAVFLVGFSADSIKRLLTSSNS